MGHLQAELSAIKAAVHMFVQQETQRQARRRKREDDNFEQEGSDEQDGQAQALEGVDDALCGGLDGHMGEEQDWEEDRAGAR